MPQLDLQRTIVAVSSGLAPSHRSIIRLSGSATSNILRNALTSAASSACDRIDKFLSSDRPISDEFPCSLSWPGRSIVTRIYYWPDSRCFTGEPSAEVHLLGSLPIVESLLKRLVDLGAQPAHRGEFTLRSFLAGKLDLTQAEGVLGVIEAQGSEQLHTALEFLGGNLSRPVRELRVELLELVAHLEAGLDFVEEDIEFISDEMLAEHLSSIAIRLSTIAHRLDTRGSGNKRRQIVLVGLPNAGKSSLFNALLGSERAIVAEQAGTTRDAIAETLLIANMPIELVDTAGIELIDGDSPRQLAQSVVAQRLAQADLILYCVDLSNQFEVEQNSEHFQRCIAAGAPVVIVGTKCDLASVGSIATLPIDISVSARLPVSIDVLKEKLTVALACSAHDSQSDAMHRAAIRSKSAIDSAIESIQRARQLTLDKWGEELVAAELRISLDELAAVIGEIHTEDILGEIFSRFCIGK